MTYDIKEFYSLKKITNLYGVDLNDKLKSLQSSITCVTNFYLANRRFPNKEEDEMLKEIGWLFLKDYPCINVGNYKQLIQSQQSIVTVHLIDGKKILECIKYEVYKKDAVFMKVTTNTGHVLVRISNIDFIESLDEFKTT